MTQNSQPTPENQAERVRSAIFDAIVRGDGERFSALCNQNSELIIQYFDQWAKIPEDIRSNTEAVNTWAQCLITLANAFAGAGYPGLMQTLTGAKPVDNPLMVWNGIFTRAHQLSESAQFEESNATLLKLLAEMESLTNNVIDDYRPKIYGMIGTNFFRMEDIKQAQHYTELALSECERTSDHEGVRIYADNLATILAADGGSVVAQCRKTIARAQDLSDEMRYEFSNTILHGTLAEIERTPQLRTYRPKVYGLLGLNYFRLNDLVQAKSYTELALHDCKADKDQRGVRVYQVNLEVISRG